MKDLLTRLSKARFPYEPLITVRISRNNLINNYREFQKLTPNGNVAPVLKSNAYGHGLIEVAKILENATAHHLPFFVVDSYFEAIALRASRIKTPILVIGFTPTETITRARLKNTSFTITSIEALRELSKSETYLWTSELAAGRIGFGIPIFPRPHKIHLKIDTGMRRQGILPEQVAEAIDIIEKNKMIVLEGICSHFSDADNTDESSTESQIHIWNRIVQTFKNAFPHLPHIHVSNTDGHRFANDISANVSRLGLGLYGLIDGNIFSPSLDLHPALEMKTTITGIKQLHLGETVGYGNTFQATKEMTIATIPVGYYEGLDRRLSNPSPMSKIPSSTAHHSHSKNPTVVSLLVGSERIQCPIIGRISMNITIIDVSNVPNPLIGMEVVVISDRTNNPNSIVNMAKVCGTIPHEIAVKIPAHLKRVAG